VTKFQAGSPQQKGEKKYDSRAYPTKDYYGIYSIICQVFVNVHIIRGWVIIRSILS